MERAETMQILINQVTDRELPLGKEIKANPMVTQTPIAIVVMAAMEMAESPLLGH